MPTKRLSFLLLDANIIIELFRLGLWAKIVDQCDIHVGKTVLREAAFYEDENGHQHKIDLTADITEKKISVFEVSFAEMREFKKQFDPPYLEKLDPGETEALVKLQAMHEESRLCSADAIVFKVLAGLNMDGKGISLQEVLQTLGQTRTLEWSFCCDFRKKYSAIGHTDSIQGRGLKPVR